MKSKGTILSLMLTIFALISSSAYANDTYNEQKMYVSGQSVQLMQDQIILATEEGLLVAKALFADADGLFVYASDLEALEVKGHRLCTSKCGDTFDTVSQVNDHERKCSKCKRMR